MPATSDNALAASIVDALHSVTGHGVAALHEPVFRGREWELVKDCLDTGWVSTAGAYVGRFEQMLVDLTGVPHAVARTTGTAALSLGLPVAGVVAGDEVLVPTLTFVATANAVRHCSAVPHFIDSSPTTLGVDPVHLDVHLRDIAVPGPDGPVNRLTGRRMRVVVAMHTFGHPVDLDPLSEVCARHGLLLVEDAAESLGSLYKGRHPGHWGRFSTLSFNGNKVVTTGGGGAILTGDAAFADRVRHLSTTAKIPHAWAFDHDEVGYNYRMPNLNAALGCAQLEQLPAFLVHKRALAGRYDAALAAVSGVSLVREPDFARSNYWLNALRLDLDRASARDTVLEATNMVGLMTRPAWTLMHRLPMYAASARMPELTVAEDLARRLINIPSGVGVGADRFTHRAIGDADTSYA